jgi:uncharacterized protein with HEPN domain
MGIGCFCFPVVKCVEILGEAASRVSDETRTTLPFLSWRDRVSMRNRLIHGYFDIDRDIVWSTVTRELPALVPLLEPLIRENPQSRCPPQRALAKGAKSGCPYRPE